LINQKGKVIQWQYIQRIGETDKKFTIERIAYIY